MELSATETQRLRDEVARLAAANAKLESDLAQAHTQLAYLQRMVFGRKAERFEDPNQQALFTDGDHEAAAAPPEAEMTVPAHTRKKRGGGRMKIKGDLPCVDILHELPERDLVDPATGEALYEAFGFRVTKKLACEPMRLYTERHLHVKYRRVAGEHLADGDRPEALTAPATQEGLEDCLAAPSLLAELTHAKYVLHTPFDRQLKDIKRRSGVEISNTTVSRWALQIGQLCGLLVDLMKRRVIQHSTVIQHDDTPVRQQPPKNGKQKKCVTARFWSAVGQRGSPGDYVVFDYTENRQGHHVADWFAGVATDTLKFIQCDDYAGYDALFGVGSGLQRLACWAHARKRFHDLRASHPGASAHAMGLIQKLYAVERELETLRKDREDDPACDFDRALWHAERQQVRADRVIPLLDAYFTWCREEKTRIGRPQDPVVKAINYSLNQEAALRRYVQHGEVEIDNNACERSIRPLAIGKKNWLFTGSKEAGQSAAVLFSLISSAERHGLNPRMYLEDLIRKMRGLGDKPTEEQLEPYLPDRWEATAAVPLTPSHAPQPGLPRPAADPPDAG